VAQYAALVEEAPADDWSSAAVLAIVLPWAPRDVLSSDTRFLIPAAHTEPPAGFFGWPPGSGVPTLNSRSVTTQARSLPNGLWVKGGGSRRFPEGLRPGPITAASQKAAQLRGKVNVVNDQSSGTAEERNTENDQQVFQG